MLKLNAAALVAAELSGRALDAGDYSSALEHANAAMYIDEHSTAALIARARCHMEAFNPYDAQALLRHAIECAPSVNGGPPGRDHAAWNNLFFSELYGRADPLTLAAMHVEWAKPVKCAEPVEKRRRPRGARINVGFQSADFCRHPVGRFIAPVLALLDRKRFRVHAYHVGRLDEGTTELAKLCDAWFWQPAGMHEALEAQIRDDALDVLFDLAGHTQGSMIEEIFAHRPAPVQVSYLGYPFSTGLPAIDYRLVSRLTDPDGAEKLGPETLLRLPGPFLGCWPYDFPITDEAPRFTFGCFNRTHKINPLVIELWADCMHASPRSTLLLKARGYADQQLRAETLGWFATYGIEASRITLRPIAKDFEQHMRAHNEVLCALDTHPYSGTTTTFDALHMGVPVVTLEGPLHVSRVSASLLRAIDEPELVARSPDEYVRIAAAVADYQLAAARHSIRAKRFNTWLAGYTPRLVKDIGNAIERLCY